MARQEAGCRVPVTGPESIFRSSPRRAILCLATQSDAEIIRKMNDLSKARATWLEVGEESAAQRIDNFLLRRLKGVPKSHVYRVLRSGEVRVNSGRVKPEYRLQAGDRIRIPPVRTAAKPPTAKPAEFPIVHEDAALLVIDKPAGVAVHGGSGVSFGVIESLRAARPQAKIYFAVVRGRWEGKGRELRESLHKYVNAQGERRVSVREDGIAAVTRVKVLRTNPDFSLLEVGLLTGRTHQIRVHLAHAGHPVLGDEKYGDFELNRALAKRGVRRLFLHAGKLAFNHPSGGERLRLEAALPADMSEFIKQQLQ